MRDSQFWIEKSPLKKGKKKKKRKKEKKKGCFSPFFFKIQIQYCLVVTFTQNPVLCKIWQPNCAKPLNSLNPESVLGFENPWSCTCTTCKLECPPMQVYTHEVQSTDSFHCVSYLHILMIPAPIFNLCICLHLSILNYIWGQDRDFLQIVNLCLLINLITKIHLLNTHFMPSSHLIINYELFYP